MEEIRALEYPQLLGKTYLDHAGTTPWAKSLVDSFATDMMTDLYGNPHSEHAPSKLADTRVEATREKALGFFNADPAEWDLVFVANATAAIKLVHDCFRDHAIEKRQNWWYGYHKDAHTSVVGVREGTRTHRCFRNDREVELWIESRGLGGANANDLALFAYPGQSNMTGRRLPLAWPGRIQDRIRSKVYTLLDAAALVSTTQLDLSNTSTAPDFVALSFYKIFGFPNLGALLVKKSSSQVLMNRKFFGGGTVEMVISVNDSWSSKKSHNVHSRLEDGTLPFTSIFALDLAIDTHRKIYGPSPMKTISAHTSRLIKKLYDDLTSLRHSSGIPVIVVYKDAAAVYGQAKLQGATIAFNIQSPKGDIVSFADVEKEADKNSISVRSGSLCNPGGIATYLKWSPKELRAAYDEGHRCSEPLAQVFGKPIGVVRVSLGAMSSDEDVQRFVTFVRETYLDVALPEVAKVGLTIDIPSPVKAPKATDDVLITPSPSPDSEDSLRKPHNRLSVLSMRELKPKTPRVSVEMTSDDACSTRESTMHKMKFRLMGAMRMPRRIK
ncbi:unnamed protein product [Zymoseptoria tritici ST99CH_1A5]|uniref:Aminotransferase class V domain-containing protein n=2 Tax=Zymoseptoria tritici TaxID=1047171 RepID=A0A2H1H3X9_ZYMTR|nr:unnamed protein product [Zymoseptoria tritici ST99CH_1E4]SMR63606.1 unnamed protein product [Zymoseptoria tritici ST99CH_3D1]SMY28970.1 unnamed protein product [Zymoseptoria tritici ST99CH_1A5]